MMPVNYVPSHVCHVTVLADAGEWIQSASAHASNRMLTAADLTDTGVIFDKHFLNFTYRTFKA